MGQAEGACGLCKPIVTWITQQRTGSPSERHMGSLWARQTIGEAGATAVGVVAPRGCVTLQVAHQEARKVSQNA